MQFLRLLFKSIIMGIIVIKIDQKDKVESLVQFLKSIDYIKFVEYFDKYVKFKKRLDVVNEIAAGTELSDMTKEIDAEIKIKADTHRA